MPKKFTACVFIAILGICVSDMFYAIVARAIYKATASTTIRREIIINWAELYPFDDDRPVESTAERKSLPERIYSYVREKLESYSSEKLPGYRKLVEAAKTYEDLINWNIAYIFDYNPIVKLHDGYLTSYTESRDVTKSATATIKLAEFCNDKGIEFFYVNFPKKVCIYEDADISGILDFSNQNADKFLELLTKAGVTNYDFRTILHDEGMNHHEAFFVTDHHWKPETGLWAARHILKILHDNYNWPVNPEILSPEKFDYVIYRDWFLGSLGQKFTSARAKPDDFTMIYPKFSTSIHYELPSREINTSGDFTVMYALEALHNSSHDSSTYGIYDYWDKAIAIIHNNFNHSGRKILTVHDSFSDVVMPFLALGVTEVCEVDLRHFNGSLRNLISSYKPDAIAVIYMSDIPGRPGEFKTVNRETDEKLYDFR